MNKKDALSIGIDLSILMDSILDKNSKPDDVANMAITFAASVLKSNPEVRVVVDRTFSNYESGEDFNRNWDREIAWLKWEKEMLR